MSQGTKGTGMPRRDFLKTTAGVTGAAFAANLLGAGVFSQATDTIKVGLIGCGGRGTGAARDCVGSSEGVELVAMGDAFGDRLNGSRNNLKEALGDKFKVTDDTAFSGFDAFEKVLATDCNYVILATPPGFRPIHFTAAIAAGKNVFMEKPVAVCPNGIRMVWAAGDQARAKGLGVVAGTQRRHQEGYVETIKRIHDGAIGDVLAAQCYWNQGGLWKHDRKPEYSDIEWQLRNWLYFTWIGGDHICEQHVHNIDVMNWVIGTHPEKVVTLGGRQARTDPAYGQIFDHFAADFTYPDGVKVMSMCRQIGNCQNNVSEFVIGSEGTSGPGGWINGKEEYRHKGGPNAYAQEHADNIAAIRAGEPLMEAYNVATSTACAIMARMSAYTGKEVTWDFVMRESKLNLVRDIRAFGDMPVDPVPMPGQTELI